MIEKFLLCLVVALALYVIYWVAGKFITGTPRAIIGLILGVIWLGYALQQLGFLGWIE